MNTLKGSSSMQPAVIANDKIATKVSRLRSFFAAGRTRPLTYRKQQLAALERFLKERESDIQQALQRDLGKSALEAMATEISFVVNEIKFARRHLNSWVKPERIRTALIAQPGKSRIYREPLGVVLIIGPWNYPVQLTLAALVGAIAGGNCAVIKPSEIASATSELLAELLPRYLDNDCVQIVQGGPEETTALLAEKFDHILYTGNGTVGRIIMQAAAEHLTPVTLELGGKSPCIVDRNTDIPVAVRRIVWGKFLNAGQSCLAPDYVLVHRDVEAALLKEMKQTVAAFYSSDPRTSKDYGRIINARHFRRLMGLLASGDVLVGAESNEDELYVAPTILYNVSPDSPVMGEEIFGPILPVLSVNDISEAIAFINERPKPLALYLYSNNKRLRQQVIDQTSSGAVVVNHNCIHAVVPTIPFGGVGASGMGSYHGKATFDMFTHRKPVLVKPTIIDLKFLYPPYTKTKGKVIRSLL